ncbi:hypothetical protein MKY95_07380 [Paenibacillus sp. FSL P4-0176]|uniref:hypothetical protein n=1 Tax=Paenibacillus sp. FSL P4-0176 TaxID=2921631 RepID=UPI0030CBF434
MMTIVGIAVLSIILYPAKVLLRWLLGFFEYRNTLRSWITFIGLSIAYLIFITQYSGEWDAVIRGSLAVIPVFLMYLMVDLQKAKLHSKVVSFFHHIATRIVISIIAFGIVIIFYQQQFYQNNVDDHLFLISTPISIIYVCVIMRRRKKKVKIKRTASEAIESLKR